MRVLLILMWKHKVVRVRRFIRTTLDLACPLMFFILFYLMKPIVKPPQYMHGGPKSAQLDEEPNKEIIALADIMPPPHWIMYYPETVLTNSLMDEVGPKLDLKRLATFPDHSERGYFPYSNETGLPQPDLVAEMRFMEAIVIFQNMAGESWPDRLNYTIRMKGDFGTESYKSQDDSLGPHRMYGLKYGTFMRIQWAVDTSYIKLLTGNEVPQVVSLQEFHSDEGVLKIRNESIRMVGEFMRLLTWISLLMSFTFLLSRLLEERTSGIQELLRMVGVSLVTLRLSHVLNMWPVGLIYAIGVTVCVKVTDNPFIENSSWFLIFVMMFLYFNFVISMAFLCSYVLRDSQYAGSVSALLYVLVWIPGRSLLDRDMPYIALLGIGFIPNMPMYWFWTEVTAHELYHSGAGFSSMATAHTDHSASILISYIYLLLQTALCYMLTWYLSLVRPGKFGQALPWNFFLKPQYWRENEVTPNLIEEDKGHAYDPRYFEPAPPNSIPGIKIVNVSKIYPKHQALKNVSLDVYKGDITVLLGHNGAGKTTIMNIITGMTSATHGHVYVMGKDTVTQKQEVRKHLGLCPQHNVFFGDLTVREHIMFYTLLRGSDLSMKTIAEAEVSTKKLAEKLGLSEKLNAMTSQLSGGMQRRVQLGCALAGGADVLILDEPTSGLDVETRRGLWDLLLSLRGDRTVLLTTHYMEEADALGDRVAAIKDGELRCSATTMHLKKAVGTGYRLSFVTTGTPQEEAITQVVTSHVPDASLKERTINSLVYNLPVTDTSKFPALFAALESQRSGLGIESMGIGVATLEEVFMKLCSDIDTTLSEDEVDTTLTEPLVQPAKITGIPLYLRQFYVLIKRQFKYILYKKYNFFLLQFLLPVILIAQVTNLTNNSVLEDEVAPLAMNLDMYGDRAGSRVMYHVEGPDVTHQDVDTVRRRFPKVTFEDTRDIATAILRTSRKDIFEYNNYLAGVEVNDTDAKVLYTTIVRHAAPVGLNLLSNILASHYISWSDGKTITTINDPVNKKPLNELLPKIQEAKGVLNGETWSVIILFIILSTNINSISLPCKERETGTRHIHVMSGCPAWLLWVASILFHGALFFVTILVPLMLAAVTLDEDNTIDQPDFLFAYTTLLFLGSMAFVAFGYLVSFNFGGRTTSVILSFWIFLFGVITPAIKAAMSLGGLRSRWTYVLVPVRVLCVPHALAAAASAAMLAAHDNAQCTAYRQFCPNLPFENPEHTERCCAGYNPRSYFCFNKDEPGEGMIILTLQLLCFMTLVVLTEHGFFNGLWNKLRNINYKPVRGGPEQSEMVRAEEEYVRKTIKLPKKQIPDSLLASDLHKVYVSVLGKKTPACRGVSFSVKKGECFGILGVNGAGKSTVFKMITAQEVATRGKIFANGHRISPSNPRYLKTLGYCPQFFGLDYFLTGEDNLEMILTLRGYDNKSVKEEVKNWIQIVGLEKYARNKVDSYSGGCVRRMGAAAALCSDADLSLLDEPSAGVDPAARRRLWIALRKALRRQRSIIISSHSMDEMEALCQRIAIMSRGVVRALGTAHALRAAHAQGYAVRLKLANMSQDVVDGDKTLNSFKGQLHEKFNCSLKDEHVTMLNYHINETMQLSDLFIALEALRREFPSLIEDYSVSETTLEEVFLAFAKEKPQDASA